MPFVRWILAATAVSALSAAPTAQAAETIYGVTPSSELLSFSSDSPESVSVAQPIGGLPAGERIRGIDVRPATGELLAVGSSGRLFTIDPQTAGAREVSLDPPAALSGTSFGVDVDPVADAVRVLSDSGQNLRIALRGAGAPRVVADTPLTPSGSAVAAAFSSPFNGATATRLFAIDSRSDRLEVVDPPAAGSLAVVGALGVDASPDASLDIAPSDGAAYAAIRPEGDAGSRLYAIDLVTGAARAVGPIGGGEAVTAIAIARQAPTLFVLRDDGVTLQTVSSAAPFTATGPGAGPLAVRSSVAVAGLQAGEGLLGIDVRPADGQLIGLGTTGRVYALDPASGQATSIAAAPAALDGTDFGIDFDPVTNALRVVSDTGQNLRIAGGGAGPVGVDAPLRPGAPRVVAAAHTNAFAGATTSALYDLAASDATLKLQGPPEAGALATVGALGVAPASTGGRTEAGFDVAAQDNSAFAALAPAGPPAATDSGLYRVDLATGAARSVAGFGPGGLVRDLTAAGAGSIGLSASTYVALEGGDIAVTVVRRGGEGVATVDYAVANGPSGALTFGPGESLKTFLVPNPDNPYDNADRALRVTLARAAGGYGLTTTAADVVILDDDPTLSPGTGARLDKVKPVVLVAVSSLKLKTLRSAGVSARYSCNEACTVAGAVKLGPTVIGTGTARLTGPGVGRIRVKLTPAGKRRVGTRRTRRLRFVASVTDTAANVAVSTASFSARR